MAGEIECIVCGGRTTKLFDWGKEVISRTYSKLFGVAFPASIKVPNYAIRRCQACSLEFADPMRPGNAEFYGWIAAQERYYPKTRWEWGVVKQRLAVLPTGRNILEVGCGVGHFLDFLKDIDGIGLTGLDTNAASVEECRRRGLTALQSEIADFKTDATFDAVCAFHCLEHVSDPVSLVRHAVERLSPGGQVFVSVPYSPTSLEIIGEDCLNLPPHHLTRWNAASLRALARVTGMELSLQAPAHAPGRLRAALHSLSSFRPELKGTPTPLVPVRLLMSPGAMGTAVAALRFYASRDRIDGAVAGDTVLAIFASAPATRLTLAKSPAGRA